jgi:hypothetical protein
MQKIIDVFYVQKLSSSQRSIFGRSRKDLGRTYAWISIAAAIFARESGTDVPVEAPPEEVLAHELAHILTELGQVGLDIVGEKRNLLSADGASLGRLDRSPLTTQEARRLISFYNYLELNTDQKRRMQTVLPNFVER